MSRVRVDVDVLLVVAAAKTHEKIVIPTEEWASFAHSLFLRYLLVGYVWVFCYNLSLKYGRPFDKFGRTYSSVS